MPKKKQVRQKKDRWYKYPIYIGISLLVLLLVWILNFNPTKEDLAAKNNVFLEVDKSRIEDPGSVGSVVSFPQERDGLMYVVVRLDANYHTPALTWEKLTPGDRVRIFFIRRSLKGEKSSTGAPIAQRLPGMMFQDSFKKIKLAFQNTKVWTNDNFGDIASYVQTVGSRIDRVLYPTPTPQPIEEK